MISRSFALNIVCLRLHKSKNEFREQGFKHSLATASEIDKNEFQKFRFKYFLLSAPAVDKMRSMSADPIIAGRVQISIWCQLGQHLKTAKVDMTKRKRKLLHRLVFQFSLVTLSVRAPRRGARLLRAPAKYWDQNEPCCGNLHDLFGMHAPS